MSSLLRPTSGRPWTSVRVTWPVRNAGGAFFGCRHLASPGSVWTPNGTLRTFPMKIWTLAIGQASWAQRNPILSFRFVGVFLFRFADRTLCGSLFQDPPRITKSDRPRIAGEPRPSAPYLSNPSLATDNPGSILIGPLPKIRVRRRAVSACRACAIQLRIQSLR
jgi:hypothetical protein